MRFHLKHWFWYSASLEAVMAVLFWSLFKTDEWYIGGYLMFFMLCFVSFMLVMFDLSEKEREQRLQKLVTLKEEAKKQAKAVIPQDDGRVVMFLDDRVRVYGTDNRYHEILYANVRWFVDTMDKLGVKP